MAKFVVLHDTLVLNMIYFQHRRIQCFRLTEMMLCNHIMLLWIRTKIINLHHHTRTRAILLWFCLLHIQITDDAKNTFANFIILNWKPILPTLEKFRNYKEDSMIFSAALYIWVSEKWCITLKNLIFYKLFFYQRCT